LQRHITVAMSAGRMWKRESKTEIKRVCSAA